MKKIIAVALFVADAIFFFLYFVLGGKIIAKMDISVFTSLLIFALVLIICFVIAAIGMYLLEEEEKKKKQSKFRPAIRVYTSRKR